MFAEEDDKDDTKTGSRDREDDDTGPPQKKALVQTPGGQLWKHWYTLIGSGGHV